MNHEDTKGTKKMDQKFLPISQNTESIATQVVDAALKVHRALGPGLLESVYETCLCYELKKRGIAFVRQAEVPISYDGNMLDCGLRLDVLVADSVVIELKAVETIKPLFDAQLLTYLKLTDKRLGLRINFNTPLLKNGIKRMVL